MWDGVRKTRWPSLVIVVALLLVGAQGAEVTETVVVEGGVWLTLPLGETYEPTDSVDVVVKNASATAIRLGPPYHTFPFVIEREVDGRWEEVPVAIIVLTVAVELEPGEEHTATFSSDEHFTVEDVEPGAYRIVGDVAWLEDNVTTTLVATFTIVEGEE